jgi:hypothetical protein
MTFSLIATSRKITAPGAGSVPGLPALEFLFYFYVGPLASRSTRTYQTALSQLASTLFISRFFSPRWRRRMLCGFGRGGGPLLLPVVKFLLLLLFLLRASLLHRRRGAWLVDATLVS